MKIDRQQFLQEMKVRKFIRKGIELYFEKKEQENNKAVLEEQKLRSIIRDLIKETATPDNDPAPAKSTGINVLEDLLKKIIPVLEIDYKKLTSDKRQRDSFRAHIVKGVEDVLAPPKALNKAGEVEEEPVMEQENEIEIQVDSDKPEDDASFIDIEPEKKEEPEEPPDEREAFGIGDQDETGRNIAFESFKKVQSAIVDSWDVLSDEKDQELFYDYLITNLKLYFDKFENDLGGVTEPTTDEYEQEKEGDPAEI